MATERPDAPILITSAANPAIKMMRSLGRRKVRHTERAFLVEGRRLTEEALRTVPELVRMVLVREDVPPAWWESLPLDPTTVRLVRRDVFDDASDVDHAQGVAAICALPDPPTSTDLQDATGPMLVLDRVRDPGNVGTALRTAAAAGVTVVLATRGTADLWQPKVVRAGMGAHFRLRLGDVDHDAASFLRDSGRDVVHADASGEMRWDTYDWRRAGALIVSGETEPLSEDVAPLVTTRVHLPMRGGMESLNAGVAASVLLYEAQRQGAFDQ